MKHNETTNSLSAQKLLDIGSRGVQEALRINSENNIPNVFSFNSKLMFEMPDGSFSVYSPYMPYHTKKKILVAQKKKANFKSGTIFRNY